MAATWSKEKVKTEAEMIAKLKKRVALERKPTKHTRRAGYRTGWVDALRWALGQRG